MAQSREAVRRWWGMAGSGSTLEMAENYQPDPPQRRYVANANEETLTLPPNFVIVRERRALQHAPSLATPRFYRRREYREVGPGMGDPDSKK